VCFHLRTNRLREVVAVFVRITCNIYKLGGQISGHLNVDLEVLDFKSLIGPGRSE
jgi:hypothetical protein